MDDVAYPLKIRSGCEGGGKGALVQEEKSATLATNNDQYLFQPMNKNDVIAIDKESYCLGEGWKEDTAYTLNTIDRPAVAYSVDEKCGNTYTWEEQANTLAARDYKQPQAVAYGIDPGASRDVGDLFLAEQSKTITNGSCPGHHNGVVIASGKETVGTLMANAGTKLWLGNQEAFSGDYTIIEKHTPHYIVRRLTPTECARLQGFPDEWGAIDKKNNFTEEELSFWKEVRNTHAAVNGRRVRDYTEKQMLAWYNKLHTDSAEYKMWGNGIALPTALYCMQGMAEALNEEED